MKSQTAELPLQKGPLGFPAEGHNTQESAEKRNRLLEQYQATAQGTSTYLIQKAHEDINLKRVYVLDKNILQGTKLTPNIRARIRSFVMDQCAKQWILRETSALACNYIDLYFLRKGYCEVQEVQTMAISCLMLARKQQEGKLPTISFNVFSKEALMQWEKKVAKKLQYQLLPPTHITYAQHVAHKWDLFTSNQSLFSKRFGDCEVGINSVLRSFYQQLDCLFLVVQSLRWELELVVINLFYLHAYSLNVPQKFVSHQLSDQQFVRSLYSQKDEFNIFFQKFLLFYSKQKSFKLISQLGVYLRMFMQLKGSKKEFSILNSEPRFKSIRVWDKLQTYTKESYDLAKKVMEKIRRN